MGPRKGPIVSRDADATLAPAASLAWLWKEVFVLKPRPVRANRVGAILAGGQSRRMGCAKAGLVLPSGKSFAAQIRDELAPLVDEVVLLGHGEGAPPELECIADARDCAGPVSGLVALVRSGRAHAYLVTSCDMPFLTRQLLQRLCHAASVHVASIEPVRLQERATQNNGGRFRKARPFVAVACRDAQNPSHIHPFPLWVHQDAAPFLESFVAAGQQRWMKLLERLPLAFMDVATDESTQMQNLNRPEDLTWLQDEPSGS